MFPVVAHVEPFHVSYLQGDEQCVDNQDERDQVLYADEHRAQIPAPGGEGK